MAQDRALRSRAPTLRRTPAALAPLLGLGLVSLGTALWATVGVGAGLMQSEAELGSTSLGLARTALGAVALLAVAAALGRLRITGRLEWRALACFGLANAVFQICLFRAFAEVGVTVTVAVTACLPPLIVTACAALRAGRLPGTAVMTALVVATLGVLLIVRPTEASLEQPPVTAYGVTLLLLASVAFSVVAVSARHMCRACDPICASGLGLAICALGLACFGGLSGTLTLGQFGALGVADLAIVLYLGIGATAGAYLAFNIGLRLCPSSANGLVASMIEPALAALLAAILLGERLSPITLLGCVTVTLAMVILSLAELRTARPVAKSVEPGRHMKRMQVAPRAPARLTMTHLTPIEQGTPQPANPSQEHLQAASPPASIAPARHRQPSP